MSRLIGRESGVRRMCFSCEKRPARMLKTKRRHYVNATEQAVFCTQACAADWALLQSEMCGEFNLYFCTEHGWDEEPDVNCMKCDQRD